MEAHAQADQRGFVWRTVRQLASDPATMGIEFAVVGGIALQHRRLQRSTRDVDLLVASEDDIRQIHVSRSVAEVSAEGPPFVNLRSLVELKRAGAKSAAHRIKDRSDVLELIHIHGLHADYAAQLDSYVPEEFVTLAELPPSEPD